MKLGFVINHPSLVYKYHVKSALVLSMEYLQSIIQLGNMPFHCWSFLTPYLQQALLLQVVVNLLRHNVAFAILHLHHTTLIGFALLLVPLNLVP